MLGDKCLDNAEVSKLSCGRPEVSACVSEGQDYTALGSSEAAAASLVQSGQGCVQNGAACIRPGGWIWPTPGKRTKGRLKRLLLTQPGGKVI